jgi:uncharacterized delta-60 repeat protein
LDNTFNGGEPVLVEFFDAGSVVLQSNGKIVVGCTFTADSSGPFGVFRLNSNGTIDSSFGTLGQVIIDAGGSSAQIGGIAVQTDDKIVMAGSGDATHITAARITKNGVIDLTFGIGGRMFITVGNNLSCVASCITLQGDGKAVIVGDFRAQNGNNNMLVIRLNTFGFLDNSFAGNGKQGIKIDGFVIGNAVAVQDNGKIIAVGTCLPTQTTLRYAMCRLDKHGDLDPNFGNAGIVTTKWPQDIGNALGVAIQANGRIVVEGTVVDGFGTARYLAQ